MLARRSESTWYVAGISGDSAVDLSIPLSFLDPEIEYGASLLRRGGSDDELIEESSNWSATDQLMVQLRAADGFVLVLVPSEIL